MLRCAARPTQRQSCSEGSKAALQQPPGVARPSARGLTHRQTHPTVTHAEDCQGSTWEQLRIIITRVLPFRPRHQAHTACNRHR